jgi:hypothetical protein
MLKKRSSPDEGVAKLHQVDGLTTQGQPIDTAHAGPTQPWASDPLHLRVRDLRSVRYFFTKGKYKDQVKAFFSLDGDGVSDVTTGGVGSKRYRVTFNSNSSRRGLESGGQRC